MDNRQLHRRTFFASGAAAALGLAGGSASADDAAPPGTLREAPRDVKVIDDCDVVVCGGGPAGAAAAIAAARAGARTRLIEANGCLGGIWTAGLLSWILDARNKGGIMREIVERLRRQDAAVGLSAEGASGSEAYRPETMKLLLEQMCQEAGVTVRLHTMVVGAVRDAAGRITHAITESKSGREAFAGKTFVDATGDGDLSARAGCSFDYGREGTGQAQPMSMIAMLVGLDPKAVSAFTRGLSNEKGQSSKARLLAEMTRCGVTPSYSQPTMFYLGSGLYCLMANHEYGVSPMSADDLTAATLRGRAEVHRLVYALRKNSPAWADVQIVATAEHIGVREGRRIRGLYQVSKEDLRTGARHDDAVCRVFFGVDVHSTDPSKEKGIAREGLRARAYDIPYRSLIAADVKGLLLAGRCISGDFLAHSSYRVTGNSVACGQAAGAAAALAAKSGKLPQDVPFGEIKQAVEKQPATQPAD